MIFVEFSRFARFLALESFFKSFLESFLRSSRFLESFVTWLLESLLENFLESFLECCLEGPMETFLRSFLESFFVTLLEDSVMSFSLNRAHRQLPGKLPEVFSQESLFRFSPGSI